MYKATGDHYYLQVAKKALRNLQQHTRVKCGFAAINDIRTGKNEDRMDSFVLSETFKYLYLIFAEPSDIDLDLDSFIFTTEAHLLPLSLGQLGNITRKSGEEEGKNLDSYKKMKSIYFFDLIRFISSWITYVPAGDENVLTSMNYMRSCPSPKHLFPETVRKPLRDLISGVCPRTASVKRISALEFRVSVRSRKISKHESAFFNECGIRTGKQC